MSIQAKIATIAAFYFIGITATIFVSVLLDGTAAAVSFTVAQLIALAFFVRTFQGDGEDLSKSRPWWRMTERAASSLIVGLIFTFQVINAIWALDIEPFALLVVLSINSLIALAFFNSSWQIKALTARTSV
ncbi:hypothetical protein [Klugiella xanthotipulae]|uniref:hypothetical protein n=1 Tax=Klugiella xanthotipulae TaxID=244735 RepID=UPI0011537F33|nr:hypothetical protein [Klugiella xanthotipulae]